MRIVKPIKDFVVVSLMALAVVGLMFLELLWLSLPIVIGLVITYFVLEFLGVLPI